MPTVHKVQHLIPFQQVRSQEQLSVDATIHGKISLGKTAKLLDIGYDQMWRAHGSKPTQKKLVLTFGSVSTQMSSTAQRMSSTLISKLVVLITSFCRHV